MKTLNKGAAHNTFGRLISVFQNYYWKIPIIHVSIRLVFCLLLTSCHRLVFCPYETPYKFYFSQSQYDKYGWVGYCKIVRFRDEKESVFMFTDYCDTKERLNGVDDLVYLGKGIPCRKDSSAVKPCIEVKKVRKWHIALLQ
jgi:hypothetical protein